ncbi:MAG: 50S ribosomal protein L15 [Oligoflexales bacterium]
MEELKRLHNLKPGKGRVKDKKRLGRGPGSGLGKTAGKGHKGQLARKGGKVAPGFEGGQMPLYRRLPKRGFTNIFGQKFNPINLDTLNRFENGTKVTPELLKQAGLLRIADAPIKLLGRGALEKKLNIQVHKASKSAKDAVAKSGGTLEEI